MFNDKFTYGRLFICKLNHANSMKSEEYTIFSNGNNAKHLQTLSQSLGNDILSHQYLNDPNQRKTEV